VILQPTVQRWQGWVLSPPLLLLLLLLVLRGWCLLLI
jgi:hypothetical protein